MTQNEWAEQKQVQGRQSGTGARSKFIFLKKFSARTFGQVFYRVPFSDKEKGWLSVE
jgi:hypothetical protein